MTIMTIMKNEVTIDLFDKCGSTPFIADGDMGRALRMFTVRPLLDLGTDTVIIDCSRIENMTDSFANAFFGPLVLDDVPNGRIKFKGCSPLVKSFVMSAGNIEQRRRERA
jgi:hypothetical protein